MTFYEACQYLTVGMCMILLYKQGRNWWKFRSEGNGANRERVLITLSTLASLLHTAYNYHPFPFFIAVGLFMLIYFKR